MKKKKISRFKSIYFWGILILLVVNYTQSAYGQSVIDDSIRHKIQQFELQNKTDEQILYIVKALKKTNKKYINAFLYNSLANAYFKKKNYNFALLEYKRAYFLYLGKKDTLRFLEIALNIVNIELCLENFSKAKLFFDRITPYLEKLKENRKKNIRYLFYKSVYFWSMGEYAKAYQQAYKVEKIASLDSSNLYLPKIYQIIGNVYSSLKNYVLAENYYFEALQLFQQNKNFAGQSLIYKDFGEAARAKGFILSAIKYHKLAITFGMKANCNICLSYAYLNIVKDFLSENNNDSALYYIKFIKNIPNRIDKNDINALVSVQKMIIFRNKGKYAKAKEELENAIEIAEIGVKRDTKIQVYTDVVRFYKEIGKSDLALKYLQRLYFFEKYSKTGKIEEMITKMTNEHTVDQQKIKNLTFHKNTAEQKTLNQRLYIYLILFFLLVFISLSVLIYGLYDKMKIKNLLLAKQNRSILEAEVNLQVANDSLHKIAFRFQNIIEKLPILVYARNAQGKFVFWNHEAQKITGYNQNFFDNNRDALSLLIPNKLDRKKLEDAFFRGEFKWIETNFLTRKNQLKKLAWISVSESAPIPGWKDWGIAIDITSRSRFELFLERERAILHSIISSIPFMIYYKDINGKYLGYNPAFGEFIGNTEGLVGKTDFDLYPIKEALRNKNIEEQIIKNKKIYSEEKWTNLANNGEILLHTLKFPFENLRKEVLGVVTLSQDVTERYEFEQELKNQKEKAETSDKLKSAFLANMSHEIRTPLNAIIGFADLLKSTKITEKQRDLYIQYIDNSGNTLLSLIDDIIDTAKIEAGQLKIRRGHVYLNRLLDEIYLGYEEIKKKLNKSHIELILEKEIEDKNFSFFSDSVRLRQIFSNLIGNALKFVDKGYVKFGYKKIEGFIQFYVEDTGIGIAKDKHKIIFERFGQVESSYKKNIKGTGLGLSITNRLVELLGGKIWLESAENKGSKFYFTLPYEQQKNGEVKKEKSKFELSNISGKTIMIVEDDHLNYIVLKNILSKINSNVIWKHNGKEALELIQQNKIHVDAILMDIQMPLMNGEETTKEIRKLSTKIPIIAITAYALSGEEEQMLASGCNEYLTKPIKADLLYKLLDKYL